MLNSGILERIEAKLDKALQQNEELLNVLRAATRPQAPEVAPPATLAPLPKSNRAGDSRNRASNQMVRRLGPIIVQELLSTGRLTGIALQRICETHLHKRYSEDTIRRVLAALPFASRSRSSGAIYYTIPKNNLAHAHQFLSEKN